MSLATIIIKNLTYTNKQQWKNNEFIKSRKSVQLTTIMMLVLGLLYIPTPLSFSIIFTRGTAERYVVVSEKKVFTHYQITLSAVYFYFQGVTIKNIHVRSWSISRLCITRIMNPVCHEVLLFITGWYPSGLLHWHWGSRAPVPVK